MKKNDYIEVRWEIDDGYVGKSRPHTTRVYFDELDDDASDEEIFDYIEEAIQSDFEQRIQWYPLHDLDESVAEIKDRTEQIRKDNE